MGFMETKGFFLKVYIFPFHKASSSPSEGQKFLTKHKEQVRC